MARPICPTTYFGQLLAWNATRSMITPSRIVRRARDHGPRSGFRQRDSFEKFATVTLLHQSSTTGGPTLRPLRLWGGELGQRRVFLLWESWKPRLNSNLVITLWLKTDTSSSRRSGERVRTGQVHRTWNSWKKLTYVLRWVETNESTIFGDFNARVENNAGIWSGGCDRSTWWCWH